MPVLGHILYQRWRSGKLDLLQVLLFIVVLSTEFSCILWFVTLFNGFSCTLWEATLSDGLCCTLWDGADSVGVINFSIFSVLFNNSVSWSKPLCVSSPAYKLRVVELGYTGSVLMMSVTDYRKNSSAVNLANGISWGKNYTVSVSRSFLVFGEKTLNNNNVQARSQWSTLLHHYDPMYFFSGLLWTRTFFLGGIWEYNCSHIEQKNMCT